MRVSLIRHTEVQIEAGTCYGQLDVPLAENFEQASRRVQQHLVLPVDLIYSSPSTRCLALAKQLGSPVITDERLLEYHYGDFEGQRWQQLSTKSEFLHWCDYWQKVAPPRGETIDLLIARVNLFLMDLRQKNAKHVIVVTHHGVLRAVSLLVLNYHMAHFFTPKFDFGGILQLELGQNLSQDEIICGQPPFNNEDAIAKIRNTV